MKITIDIDENGARGFNTEDADRIIRRCSDERVIERATEILWSGLNQDWEVRAVKVRQWHIHDDNSISEFRKLSEPLHRAKVYSDAVAWELANETIINEARRIS